MKPIITTPLVEAHRGGSLHAPENTLPAFQHALQLGVPWIEFDVQPAKDGTIMVIHDQTVDRTTDGSGMVDEMTAEELSRLDAGRHFSPDYAGARIPRFSDLLELVMPAETRLNVEIKHRTAATHWLPEVVRLLHQFDAKKRCVVSSFSLDALLAVRAVDAELTLMLNGDLPAVLELAERHRFPLIHVRYKTITPDGVYEAQARGLGVNTFTVDDVDSLPELRASGVSKFCTNTPGTFLAALAHGNEGPAH